MIQIMLCRHGSFKFMIPKFRIQNLILAVFDNQQKRGVHHFKAPLVIFMPAKNHVIGKYQLVQVHILLRIRSNRHYLHQHFYCFQVFRFVSKIRGTQKWKIKVETSKTTSRNSGHRAVVAGRTWRYGTGKATQTRAIKRRFRNASLT